MVLIQCIQGWHCWNTVDGSLSSCGSGSESASNSTPPRSGAFEVSLNDKLVYSKFKTGDFPQESEIRSWF